jgi:hypothetical protein
LRIKLQSATASGGGKTGSSVAFLVDSAAQAVVLHRSLPGLGGALRYAGATITGSLIF